jgi:phosphoglycerate kinase
MKSVKTLKGIKGKKVLVRTDFNVPLKGNRVLDTTRITAALPTIAYLRKAGAKVILISHIGRDPKESLKPVYTLLKKEFPLQFVADSTGTAAKKTIDEMKNGEVVLLENLRGDEREKANDKGFAKELARLADIYVNEAFPVSHRADASIVGVPKLLPSYAGIQFEREVQALSKILQPKHPFLFIQGGAKAETKIPLLKRYLKEADQVFIGGELANDFFQAKGIAIGKSAVDAHIPSLKAFLKNPKLILPQSVVVSRAGKKQTISVDDVRAGESIFDIGLPSIDALALLITKAKLIVWNGPMGWYEGGYVKGTEEVIKLLASAKGEKIIGGGDTAVLIEKKKLADKFTFVSTAGGAALEFMAKGTLPGIKALK